MVSIQQEDLTLMRNCMAALLVLALYFFLMKLVVEQKHKELLAKYNELLEYKKELENRVYQLLYENNDKFKP